MVEREESVDWDGEDSDHDSEDIDRVFQEEQRRQWARTQKELCSRSSAIFDWLIGWLIEGLGARFEKKKISKSKDFRSNKPVTPFASLVEFDLCYRYWDKGGKFCLPPKSH